MIIESVVVGLVVVASCVACRSVHQKMSSWQKSHRPNEAERPCSRIESTKSDTAEVLRIVLDHSDRREDRHRLQMAILMSQLAAVNNQSESALAPLLEPTKTGLSDANDAFESNTRIGALNRGIRKCFFGKGDR